MRSLLGGHTPVHRPESEAAAQEHEGDGEPGRRPELAIEPDTGERKHHERDSELQADAGELTAGQPFTTMKQLVVVGPLSGAALRGSCGQTVLGRVGKTLFGALKTRPCEIFLKRTI